MSGLLPRALAFLSLSWQVDSSLWSTCGWGEINYMINWSLLHFIGFLLPWIFMKLSHGLGTRHGAGAGGTQPPAGTDGRYCPWCQNHQGARPLNSVCRPQSGHQLCLLSGWTKAWVTVDRFFLLSFHWIQFYFFHMQVTQHLHMHIFFCSIHKSLTPILSPSLDVPSCCSENVLDTINHNIVWKR